MDFAVCPSCKQSVLDDDAVDCPFCGCSMSAKPGTVKPGAAKPAVAAAPLKAKIASPGPGKRPLATDLGELPETDLGDVFSDGAIPASLKRTKSRPMPVTCPMCDTVSYVAPDAAGRDVKCANPKCLVPVFTAPKKVTETKIEAPPPKRKRSIVTVALVTLVLVAAGGGIAYWIALQPSNVKLAGPSTEDLELLKEFGPAGKAVKPVKPEVAQPEPQPEPVAEQPPVVDGKELIARLLAMIDQAALKKDEKLNRSKPFCRRLAAEAYVLAGNLKGAQENLKSLDQVGAGVPFYRVLPVTLIGWRQLQAKDRKGALASAERALENAAKLPKTGRDRLEMAICLSALLISVQRDADAMRLLETHASADDTAQLAAAIAGEKALGTFDLGTVPARAPALDWQSPLNVGVATVLVGHRQSDAAKKWALSLPNDRDRAEALAAWAEANVRWSHERHEDVAVIKLQEPLESLAAPGAAFALSRLGLCLAMSDHNEEARDCLAQAVEKLESAEKFPEWTLPENLKEFYRFPRPDAPPRLFVAAAAGEAAHLAARLGDQTQAEQLLKTALTQVRTIGPGPAEIERRSKEVAGMNQQALRDQLKKDLKLKAFEEANAAANDVRKVMENLTDDAKQRVSLQTQLLEEAVGWGLAETVWSYIRRGEKPEDLEAADNLIYSHLPGLLASEFRKQGNNDRLTVVTTAWKQLVPNRPLVPPIPTQIADALAGDGAARIKTAAPLLAEASDGTVLATVSRLASEKHYDDAFHLTTGLSDVLLREDCDFFVAATAGLQGDAAVLERQLQTTTQATEKVSLGRGFIGGWMARERQQ